VATTADVRPTHAKTSDHNESESQCVIAKSNPLSYLTHSAGRYIPDSPRNSPFQGISEQILLERFKDNSHRNSQYQDEPERSIPTFAGEGDINVFFAKFESLAISCCWSESEAIGWLKTDCLHGSPAEILLHLPENSVQSYFDIKKKLCIHFASSKSQSDYQEELFLVTRKSGESIRSFGIRVDGLATKAFPFSPEERERQGIKALVRGCRYDYIEQSYVTKQFDAKTIDEAVQRMFIMHRDYNLYCQPPEEYYHTEYASNSRESRHRSTRSGTKHSSWDERHRDHNHYRDDFQY